MPFTRPSKHSLRDIFNQLFNPDTNTLTVGTAPTPPSAIGQGRKTVTTAGTPVALATDTPSATVTIVALEGNTGVVCVGGAGVVAAAGTRTGVPLNAGDSYEFDIDNLSKVFIDAAVNGEGVTFVATV